MKPKTMNKDCWGMELLLPRVEIEHQFPKIPYLNPRNGVATKHETVLVFHKPKVARSLMRRRSRTTRA